MTTTSSPGPAQPSVPEWIDDGGYEAHDFNDPAVRARYEEAVRRRAYPIPEFPASPAT